MKIPTWEPQQKLPEHTGMLMRNVSTAGAEYDQLVGLGEDIAKRGEELQNEYDLLDAQEAVQGLSDEERLMMREERERQGNAARGATVRGSDWYSKAIDTHSKGLSSGAEKIYRYRASQIRDQGLNVLSGHEAGQLQRAKEMAIEGAAARLREWIKSGAAPTDVEIEISAFKDQIKNTYKGVDTGAIEAKAEESLLKDLLIEHAMKDPEGVGNLIARYGDKVPEDFLKQVRDIAEKAHIEQIVESKMEQFRATHGNDFAGMLASVDKSGLSTKTKDALRSRVKDEFATYRAMDAMRKEQIDVQEGKGLALALSNKDYAKAREIILNSPVMTEAQRAHWILTLDGLVTAQTKEAKEAEEDPYAKDDPMTRSAVQAAIILHPEKLEDKDILALIGKGLSGNSATSLCQLLEAYRVKKDPDMAACAEVIKQWQKTNKFSSNKAENIKRAYELQRRLIQARKDFPDMDLMTTILEPYHEELKKGKMQEVFEALAQARRPRGIEGTEAGGQRIRKKIPKGADLDYELTWKKLFPNKDF